MTVREEAVQALKEGNSVVLDGVTYTLFGNPDTGAKGLDALPPEEFFVTGNDKATAEVVAKLAKELEDTKARYEALVKSSKPEKEAKKEDK